MKVLMKIEECVCVCVYVWGSQQPCPDKRDEQRRRKKQTGRVIDGMKGRQRQRDRQKYRRGCRSRGNP